MNKIIKYNTLCRTAQATPGLSTILTAVSPKHPQHSEKEETNQDSQQDGCTVGCVANSAILKNLEGPT